jgi:hypothetical protein
MVLLVLQQQQGNKARHMTQKTMVSKIHATHAHHMTGKNVVSAMNSIRHMTFKNHEFYFSALFHNCCSKTQSNDNKTIIIKIH